MNNVIQFSVRSVNLQSSPRADSAEVIAFPNRHRHSSERDLYVRALVRMSLELKEAKDARKRRLVSELKDEIDVIALHSEEMGFRDIAACCRNILRSS